MNSSAFDGLFFVSFAGFVCALLAGTIYLAQRWRVALLRLRLIERSNVRDAFSATNFPGYVWGFAHFLQAPDRRLRQQWRTDLENECTTQFAAGGRSATALATLLTRAADDDVKHEPARKRIALLAAEAIQREASVIGALSRQLFTLLLLGIAFLYTYPFGPLPSWRTLIGALSISFGAVSALALVSLTRDAAMSRLIGGKAGNIDWTPEVSAKLGISTVLIILTVCGWLFPEMSGWIGGWIKPFLHTMGR